MKRISRIILAITLVAVIGCSKTEPETVLILSITQHPSGGIDVVSISTQFQGKLNFMEGTGIFQPAGNAEDITATVEWWWENFFGANDQIVKSEQAIFSSESYATKSTSYSAGSGFILLNYYWVEIHWTDDDGSHSIQSSKAFCN